MKITVTNRSKGPVLIQLARGLDYEGHPACASKPFAMTRAVVLPDGTAGLHTHTQELPGSIGWLPGETLTGLPSAIAQVEQFRRERDAGRLVVIEEQETPPPAPAPAPPAPIEPAIPDTAEVTAPVSASSRRKG